MPLSLRPPPVCVHLAWIVLGNAALYACLRVEGAWPLAAVSLAPWVVLACGPGRGAPWRAFAAVMPAFALMHRAIGRHAAISHLVIAAAFAVAHVPSAWLVRVAARRGLLLGPAVALAWTAAELLRTLGFVPPWHRLAAALYAQLPLLQIADVAGMAGVTFVLAFCNGALAGAALAPPGGAATRVRRELSLAAALVAFTYAYGTARMIESRRAVSDGPRVLVVETDVLPDTLDGAIGEGAMLAQAEAITRAALPGAGRVDLIQWPESVTPRVLNEEFHRARSDDPALVEALRVGASPRWSPAEVAVMQAAGRGALASLTHLATALRTPMLVGAVAMVPVRGRWERRNAMYLLAPGRRDVVARHDKVLTFPVYESLPWKSSAPLVASLFARMRPRHSPPEVTPGDAPVALPLDPWTVLSPICFEAESSAYTRDWLPEARRGRLLWSHGANDAWGERGDDVLHASRFEVFRAVEGRVGIARSANAGLAGFVSPTGALHDVVGGDRAARMPAPGRPERDALRRVRALTSERESLWAELASAEDPSARCAMEAREDALRDALLRAQGEATRESRRAAVRGARVAAVRIDRRRPWYPRVGRWIEGGLIALWSAALVMARRGERLRAGRTATLGGHR